MTPIHFMVAKYIADRRRMEPRNIGVIAWHDGVVAGRFAGEDEWTMKPPKLVDREARKAYQTVVTSWRLQFSKLHLPIGRGREDVPRSSPDFLIALARYSQENFVIVSGGHATATPVGSTLIDAINGLYADLVDDSDGRDERHGSLLVRTCEDLLSPLESSGRFLRDVTPVDDLPVTFSYGYGDDDHLEALLQVVSLASSDQVTSAAMKFRCVSLDAELVPRSHCACLKVILVAVSV